MTKTELAKYALSELATLDAYALECGQLTIMFEDANGNEGGVDYDFDDIAKEGLEVIVNLEQERDKLKAKVAALEGYIKDEIIRATTKAQSTLSGE